MRILNDISRMINSILTDTRDTTQTIQIKNNCGDIDISGRGIFIDGKRVDIDNDMKTINIVITGDVKNISARSSDIYVQGNAHTVETVSGDITIGGDTQSANTTSGDIEANSINNAKTISGDISI